MCRKGRMFAPTRTWRKWHKKINTNQKRFAVASALAASALPALVMARGHLISKVAEVPLVVDGSVESTQKTKQAVAILSAIGAGADCEKAKNSKNLRTGIGKIRNRRYVARKGPLVVYANDNGITKAFRNIPGVDLAHVSRLNLLALAPGGHLGRFCVWTQGAFEALDKIFGTFDKSSEQKKDFKIPHPMMTNTDLARLINSDEVQGLIKGNKDQKTVLKPAKSHKGKKVVHKKNPLKNLGHMIKLNPYAKTLRRIEILSAESRSKAKAEAALNQGKGIKKATPEALKAQKAQKKLRSKASKAQYVKMTAEPETK